MTKRVKKTFAATACAALLLLCTLCALFGFAPKRADALTADDLLSGPAVTVEQGASLPSYMEKIWWNGRYYSSDELTAVRIATDGSSTTATVKYGRVIDLSDCDENFRLFDFIIAPASGRAFDDSVASVTVDDYEFRSFEVTLTDVYDPSNVVTLDFERRQDFWYYSSIRVSAPGQTSAGWVESSQAMRQTPFGTPLTSSFTGCPADANGNYGVISTFFDYAERAVYAQPYSASKAKAVVRDLDNSEHFLPGESTPWNGFTTGEVNLSFTFRTVADSTKACIYLFTLNGQDLTGEEIVDTTPPVVKTVDENLQNGVPEAEVSRPYRVFAAQAYDALDGKLDASDIDVRVTRPDQTTEIGVGTDGCFVPDVAGVYEIEWSIADSSGNVGRYVLSVTARGKLTDLQIEVQDNDLREQYSVGETVRIPQEMAVRGGAGAYRTSVRVLDCATGEEIAAAGGSVVFVREGYYAVVYRAEDYIGNVTMQKYFLLAEAREQPYVEEPSMPEAVLAGKPFTFPSFTATDYNSYAGTPVAANKYYEVIAEGETQPRIVREGESMIPAAGTVRYRVCAENIADPSGRYVGEERSFVAAEADSIGAYLFDPAGKVQADYSAGAEYPRYVAQGDTRLEFLNALSAANFYFGFTVPAEISALNTVRFTVRDSVDASQVSVIGISRNGAQHCTVTLDGAVAATLNLPFADTPFELYFSNGYVYINSTLIGLIGGREGMLASGRLYLTVEMQDFAGEGGFVLNRINNQTYVGLYEAGERFDMTAPVVVPDADIALIRYAGDRIEVPGARAYDVLDPVVTLSLRVLRGETEIYSSIGSAKGTVIGADIPGEYTIIYIVSDSAGNTASASYTVKVYNRSDPVLRVAGDLPAQIRVGEKVSVPAATASDYAGTALDVFVYVIDADGVMRAASDSFVAEKAGTYTVRYYCFDGYGCYTLRDYTVAAVGGAK